MQKIINSTHKKANIDLLKIRDKHFNYARWLNYLAIAFAFLPIVLTTISYIFRKIDWVDDYRDIYIGIISFLVFIIVHFLFKKLIDKHLLISNSFREEYDVRVFEMKRNPFAESIPNPDNFSKEADEIIIDPKNRDTYESWYNELFSSSHNSNVIICQLDNIIYTFCIYRDYKWLMILARSLFIITSLVVSFIITHFDYGVLFLVLVSSFTVLQLMIEDLSNIHDLISKNKKIMDYLVDKDGEIRTAIDSEEGTNIIRTIQDQILENRRQSIFVPRIIRNSYLKGKNMKKYREKLYSYMDIYLYPHDISVPSSSEQIDVLSLNEEKTTNLKVIHDRLLEIFKQVIRAFDEEKIPYLLDGGTLIGAARKHYQGKEKTFVGGFIFWDDDIDISIPFSEIERAKDVIRKHLGDKYDVQDYSDQFYSPRLSNFRIRDRKSVISEKDSDLYPLYKYRGLFIDVYAYHSIYVSRPLDYIYRLTRIHPLHRKLLKLEIKYPKILISSKKTDIDKYLKKFVKLKSKYCKRVQKYTKAAKNQKYYSYVPNYIENIKHPGPYLKKEWLYGRELHCIFEGLDVPIPSSPNDVLRAYYSKMWIEPPYKTVDELKETEPIWYHTKIKRGVSTMKHISHVDID